MSFFQWTGSSNADLGQAANWANSTDPGMVVEPGPNDTALIEVGQGLFGTLNVGALDLIQGNGAPTLSITGSSTQVTAASVGIFGGFTLDTGANLTAGTMSIDGGGTVATVQNSAILNVSAGSNDQFDIGASSGNADLLVTSGGTAEYSSTNATGTLNVGDVSGSAGTLTVSAGGYFATSLNQFNLGAVANSTGILDVTGADSQFLMDNLGYTLVGDFGTLGGSAQGTIEVTGGAFASLNSQGSFIGTTGGMAEILVSGANSDIQAGPFVNVGTSQSSVAGEILVQAGGEFDAGTDTFLYNGTIAVTGATSLFTGRILEVLSGTTLTAASGGLVHVADMDVSGRVDVLAGTVNVRESLDVEGGVMIGRGTIRAAQIQNDGRIVASGGTLAVAGPIIGTGELQILSGSALRLGGSVASGETIAFSANSTDLLLGNAAGVAAQITDFASGEAIDLLNQAASTLSYSSGALSVFNGTRMVATLEVKGSYSTANFSLASDGHGGSLISYAASHASGAPEPIRHSNVAGVFGHLAV